MTNKDQIRLIEQLEKTLHELKKTMGVEPNSRSAPSPSKVTSNKSKGYTGVTKQIYDLLQDGFFDQPREISAIQQKLRDEGIPRKVTALSGPLALLVRKRELKREKPPKGNYQYSKR